jgi:hypothetical protein
MHKKKISSGLGNYTYPRKTEINLSGIIPA